MKRRNLDNLTLGDITLTLTGRADTDANSGVILVNGANQEYILEGGILWQVFTSRHNIYGTQAQAFLSWLIMHDYIELVQTSGSGIGYLTSTPKLTEYAAKVRPGFSYFWNKRGEGDKSPLEMLWAQVTPQMRGAYTKKVNASWRMKNAAA